MNVKDKVGRTVKVGDIIVYGHNLGRCAGLRIGKVLKITQKPVPDRYEDRTPHTSFTVMSVNDDWNGKAPRLMCKKGTLQFSNRIIVLEPQQVPDTYRELLDSVPVDSVPDALPLPKERIDALVKTVEDVGSREDFEEDETAVCAECGHVMVMGEYQDHSDSRALTHRDPVVCINNLKKAVKEANARVMEGTPDPAMVVLSGGILLAEDPNHFDGN